MADKPAVLITNDDGINAPGLLSLVSVLSSCGACDVYVVAPDQEKSACAHSITTRDVLEVCRVDVPGSVKAWEVSGTPADCVLLALTSPLLPLKPDLVISGINKGSNCGFHIIYSGTVAGAREAFMAGVPAIALSLDWKRGVSTDSFFTDAAELVLPLIKAKLRDIQGSNFPKGCFFNIDIPVEPKLSKGYKTTRQGSSRMTPHWTRQNRRRSGAQLAGAKAMPGMVHMGVNLAQMGLAASVAGAARKNRLQSTEDPNVEGVGEKAIGEKEYFRNELGEFDEGIEEDDVDNTALAKGWVTITPLALSTQASPECLVGAQEWVEKNLI